MLENVGPMLLLLTHCIRSQAVNKCSMTYLVCSKLLKGHMMIRWAAQCFWCLLWTSAGGLVLPCQWVWRMFLTMGELAVQFGHFMILSQVPVTSSGKAREWNF